MQCGGDGNSGVTAGGQMGNCGLMTAGPTSPRM